MINRKNEKIVVMSGSFFAAAVETMATSVRDKLGYKVQPLTVAVGASSSREAVLHGVNDKLRGRLTIQQSQTSSQQSQTSSQEEKVTDKK